VRMSVRTLVRWALLVTALPLGTLAAGDGGTSTRSPGAELHGIEPAHSQIEFEVPFMGLAKVKGSFEDFSGALLHDERRPSASSVTLVLEAASVHTGNAQRDRHLRSADFLDVERFPRIVFTSRRLRTDGPRWVIEGDLTLHGVTRRIEVPIDVRHPPVHDPGGVDFLGFEASVTLNWRSFGIQATNTQNPWFQPSKMLVGDTMQVRISILANRRHPADIHYPGLDAVRQEVARSGIDGSMDRLAKLAAADAGVAAAQVRPWVDLGRSLYETGKGADAIALLNRLHQIAPAEPSVLVEVAQACVRAGDVACTRSALRQAKEIDPDDPATRELLRTPTP
jgi:polyisoprenoid-binding protein YceI